MNKDNYELNKNEIIENVVLNQLAIFKNSRAICTCGEIPCCDCIFDDYDEGCREARKNGSLQYLRSLQKKKNNLLKLLNLIGMQEIMTELFLDM